MAVGDIEYKFRRHYICVNPNPGECPNTWRVASPQEIGTPGTGGGDGGVAYDFDGIQPIEVSTKPNMGGTRTIVETSMNIAKLDNRED